MSSAKNIAEKKQKRKLTRKMIRIAVTKATFPVRNNPLSYKLNSWTMGKKPISLATSAGV